MSWLILILISVVFTSIGTIIQRIALKDKDSDPVVYSVIFQLFTGFIILFLGLVAGQIVFTSVEGLVGNLILMTVLYGVGNALVFKSLKQVNPSKFVVIFSTRAVFALILSTIFLQETLVFEQLIGFGLIFLSVALVSYKEKAFRFEKVDLLAFTAAFLFGAANTNDRFLLNYMNLFPFLVLSFILPAILVIGINPQKVKYIRSTFTKDAFFKILLISVIWSISAMTFFGALQLTENSNYVFSINMLSIVLTVVLSIIVFKEKDQVWQKVLGAFLSLVGLVVIVGV